MANTYKNIVITPSRSSNSDDPKIVFSGANTTTNTDITLRMYPTSNGTLSLEGSAGQLFSVTNDLTGTIYSVNDVSGIPSIEVLSSGLVKIAQYSGPVVFGSNTSTITNYGNVVVGSTTVINSTGYWVGPSPTTITGPMTITGNGSYVGDRGYSTLILQDNSGYPGLNYRSGAYNWLMRMDNSGNYSMYYSTNAYTGAGSYGTYFTFGTGGTGTATSDWRAPIFYDSNDTGYYVDQNGTSVLSNLIVNYTAASGSTSTPAVSIRKGWTGMATQIYDTVAIQSNDVTTIRVGEQDGTTGGYCQGDGFNTFTSTSPMRFFTGGSATGYIYSGMGGTLGLHVESGSTRAPIFYDNDNTAYYCDPASMSALNTLRTAGGVVVGGTFENNAYNSVSSTRLMFGGGDTTDYYIGTNLDNNGGNYTKLDLRWHTGIRMGAQQQYGGIRFFDSEDVGTLRFQIEGGSGYINKYVWMYTVASGFYSDTNSAHWYPNSQTGYGSWVATGTKNGYYGVSFAGANANQPHMMFDTSGNGGTYMETGGRWVTYYNYGNNSYGIGSSSTSSSYMLYVTGAIYATDNVVAYSDRRAKENIVPIEGALAKVLGLRGVYYNKIGKPETREVGVIAQDTKEVLPEVVSYDKENDQYGVAYGNITALLIEAVKELSAEVKRLKEKVGE